MIYLSRSIRPGPFPVAEPVNGGWKKRNKTMKELRGLS